MDYTSNSLYPNPNGVPIWPGTAITGPLIAGSVLGSDGTGNLAALGEQQGTANTGIAVMSQSMVVTQAAGGGGGAGVFNSNIVIPAQSQILRITLMVTTVWSGASTTFGIGNTVSATAYTAAGAGNGNTLGIITLTPGSNATAIGNWDNVGTSDVRVAVTSTNTGNGVGTLTVEYVPMINLAS